MPLAAQLMELLALVAAIAFGSGLLIGVGIASDGKAARAYMDDEK